MSTGPAKPTPASFLGTGWAFPPEFARESGTVRMVSDEEDVRQSLQILISTSVGERLLQPKYGCDLRRHLFDPMDESMTAYVADLVRVAIVRHEPRVTVNLVDVRNDAVNGLLLVEIDYTVRATNARANIVFPFYKGEGTDRAR